MEVKEGIKLGLEAKVPPKFIARKIFLSYPTFAFKNDEELEFEIKNSISNFFKIPFLAIQISGSSKTGFSFFKHKNFIPGKSDLDVAIINLQLFMKYSEITHKVTGGYSDLSKFPINRNNGQTEVNFFLANLNNGFFRPDLMPSCKGKTEWFNFFRALSNKYFRLFRNINAGLYSSEYYYETKQTECILNFKE